MRCSYRILLATLAVISAAAGFSLSASNQKYEAKRNYELPDGRIVNGTEVEPHSYPWQVHLLTTITVLGGVDLYTVCGGVLIGTSWVMTAAHCVMGMDLVQLTFGAHRWEDDEPSQVRVNSTVAYQHHNYTVTRLDNDIAVIPFYPPITENEFIQVIPLAFQEPSPGDMCPVTGWGLTAEDGDLSDELREVDVLIADQEHCEEMMVDIVPQPNLEAYICLDTTSYKTPCQGDSGGPLHVTEVDSLTGFERLKVAGVTSFGAQPECEQAGAVAYTSSVYYQEWIFEMTQILPH